MSNRQGRIISEAETLSIICPVCWAKKKMMCFDVRGKMREMAHPERIKEAQERRAMRLLGGGLDATDKSLILYYAYIMLCDSVSVKAKEFLGTDFNSEQIQAFFARKAVEELRKDGLLPEPKVKEA